MNVNSLKTRFLYLVQFLFVLGIILKCIFKNNNYTNIKYSFGFHPPKEKLNLTMDEWTKLFHTTNEKKEIHKNNIKEFFDKLKNVPDKLYNVIMDI